MVSNVLSKSSMVQRIWNSSQFSAMFDEEVKLQDAAPGFGRQAANLHAAKHRFESFSTPTGRCELYRPALIATAHRIAQGFPLEEIHRDARLYLDSLTSETCLQMSMLADAMDEGLCLVRLVDNEDVDPADVAGYVRNFVIRIKALFLDGGCLDQFGYAKHCFELLSQASLVIFGKTGQPRRLRAPTHAETQRCLQRMKNWVKLALEVVETEFPHYSLVCAFEIFNLREGARGPSDLGATSDSLERLAQAFKVNCGELQAQLERHRPMAENIMRERKCFPREAWQEAIKRTQRTKASRTAYPAKALCEVIKRYLAWQISTSGIEQGFSKADRLRATGTTPASEATETQALRLLHTRGTDDEICAQAQQLFAQCHPGQLRTRESHRVDRGVKRPRAETESMVAWLKKRRGPLTSGRAAGDGGAAVGILEDGADDMWGESHDRELAFQKNKQRQHKIDAYLDGTLLDKEIGELPLEAAARAKREAELDKGLVQQAARKEKAAKRQHIKLLLSDMPDKRVWLQNAPAAELRQAAVRHGFQVQTDRSHASVFVVEDASAPGERILWHAVLRGALLIDRNVLLGKEGLILQHKPFVASKRKFWLSPEFKAAHPEVSAIVELAISEACSKSSLSGQQLVRFPKDATKHGYINLVTSGQAAGQRTYTKKALLEICRDGLDKDTSGVGRLVV